MKSPEIVLLALKLIRSFLNAFLKYTLTFFLLIHLRMCKLDFQVINDYLMINQKFHYL